MDRTPIQAVIFDMDGIILDSERIVIECWKRLAERYGIENVEETCFAVTGTSSKVTESIFMQTYGPDFPYRKYKAEQYAIQEDLYPGGTLPLKPGVCEIFRYLHEHGIPFALATSAREAKVKYELEAVGIFHLFDFVICGDQLTASKPAPDIFLRAAAGLGANPADCFVLEDSHNGIRAAHNGGMHPLMVPDLMPVTQEMLDLSEAVLPSLFDVMTYLDEHTDILENNR